MSESATMIPLRQINRNMPARNSYPLDLSCELIKTTSGATDGFFVGEVPQLKACYSQGKTIDELMANMKDVIALALEDQGGVEPAEFVGVQPEPPRASQTTWHRTTTTTFTARPGDETDFRRYRLLSGSTYGEWCLHAHPY